MRNGEKGTERDFFFFFLFVSFPFLPEFLNFGWWVVLRCRAHVMPEQHMLRLLGHQNISPFVISYFLTFKGETFFFIKSLNPKGLLVSSSLGDPSLFVFAFVQ